MNEAIAFLQGKKTHLLVLLVLVLQIAGAVSDGAGGVSVGDINTGDIQGVLLTLMISTAKAAFDRFTKDNSE